MSDSVYPDEMAQTKSSHPDLHCAQCTLEDAIGYIDKRENNL